MLAQFTNPQHPELVFKMKYKKFSAEWSKSFGWPLFKPLSPEDAHLLSTLRIPLNDEQGEFDAQVLALTKILVDSLNEHQLKQLIPPQPPKTPGITKLQVFLDTKRMTTAPPHIKFLRNLQSLRMGAAHRKGDDYSKAAAAFGVPGKSLREAFEAVLTGAIALLDGLEQPFLTPSTAETTDS